MGILKYTVRPPYTYSRKSNSIIRNRRSRCKLSPAIKLTQVSILKAPFKVANNSPKQFRFLIHRDCSTLRYQEKRNKNERNLLMGGEHGTCGMSCRCFIEQLVDSEIGFLNRSLSRKNCDEAMCTKLRLLSYITSPKNQSSLTFPQNPKFAINFLVSISLLRRRFVYWILSLCLS